MELMLQFPGLRAQMIFNRGLNHVTDPNENYTVLTGAVLCVVAWSLLCHPWTLATLLIRMLDRSKIRLLIGALKYQIPM